MKTKRKFFPANTADIPALESWLEDMALEGLLPLSFNGYYAKFRQGEPQKLTYRIEIPQYFQHTPPKAMQETYGDFGWQFICSMWQQYYLFASAEECPIEPHTNPLEQSEQFEEAHRDAKRMIISTAAVFGFFLLLFLLILPARMAAFVSIFSLRSFFLPMVCLLAGCVFCSWQFYTRIRLKRELSSGIPMQHRKNYQNARRLQSFLAAAVILVIWSPVFSEITGLLEGQKRFLAREISSPLPYLPLAEIEGVVEQNTANVEFQTSLFAPVQYSIWEYCNGSHLEYTYMQVRPKLLVKQTMISLAQDMYTKNRFFYSASIPMVSDIPQPAELTAESGLYDAALYYEGEEKNVLAIRKGNSVLCVSYSGKADLLEYLSAFAALLE